MQGSLDCCTFCFSGRWLRPIGMLGVLAAGLCCGAQTAPTPEALPTQVSDARPGSPAVGEAASPTGDDLIVLNGAPGTVGAAETVASSATPADAGLPDDGNSALPDAPEPPQPEPPQQQGQNGNKPLVAAVPKTVSPNTSRPIAPIYSKYIPAGYAVRQIHGRQKLILGARDLYSVGNIGDWFVSAGWEQIWNGQPNYGTDRGAFGERLGAAAIRETSEGILTDGVFSVVLHEDPRYFVLGPQFGFVHRALYAATRSLITRSSTDGHAKPNYALWLGLASATALNNLYYPKSNRNFHDNLSSFGGAVGGSALGFAVDEYMADLLKIAHLKRPR